MYTSKLEKLVRRIQHKYEYFRGTNAEMVTVLLADKYYQRKLIHAVISSLVSLVGLTIVFVTPIDSIIVFLGLAITVYGAFETIRSLITCSAERRFLGTSSNEFKIEFEKREQLLIKDTEYISISELAPPASESKLGFQRCVEIACGEVAFASTNFDDAITSSPSIPFSIERRSGNFFSSKEETRYHQLRYLYAAIKSNERTTNDTKVRLTSSLDDMLNSTQLEVTDYFKGLVTSEAYRSRVLFKNSEGRIDRCSDGTEWFPRSNGVSKHELASYPISGISGHIGTTPFALSADGKPMFARQKKKNAIGGGRLVFRGSGSMDFKDLDADPDQNDFFKTIKHSMARELVEETNKALSLAESKLIIGEKAIVEIREMILMSGFFRWVDRCGKPEFLGVVRLPEDIKINDFDGYEVGYHDFLEEISPLKSSKDVISLYNQIKSQTKYPVALSTLMAFRRVAEICSYDLTNSKEQLRIKQQLLDALNLVNEK